MALTPSEVKLPEPDALALWVIYDRPRDYPHGYVLRPQYALSGGRIKFGLQAWCSESIDALRELLPPGLINIGRSHGDDSKIVEVWV